MRRRKPTESGPKWCARGFEPSLLSRIILRRRRFRGAYPCRVGLDHRWNRRGAVRPTGYRPVSELTPRPLLRMYLAHCFHSQRPVSASQTQSVNNRFKSGWSGSSLTRKPKRSQSSSPGHLPVYTCRRGSSAWKCAHPSAAQPQCGQRSTSQPSRWRSPTGAPQSGHGLSCLCMLLQIRLIGIRRYKSVLNKPLGVLGPIGANPQFAASASRLIRAFLT